jgi:sorbose reductase
VLDYYTKAELRLTVQAFKADVSDQKKIQELMKTIYHDLGPVGGVVCNAGELAVSR